MTETLCHCGFGDEYFTLEGNRSICTVCGGEVAGRQRRGSSTRRYPHEPAPIRPVLVVDDQPFFRMRIRDILEQTHHQVVEAGDGIEAVRALAAGVTGRGGEPRGAGGPGDPRLEHAGSDRRLPDARGAQGDGRGPPGARSSPRARRRPELLKKLGQLKAKKYLNKSSKNLEELPAAQPRRHLARCPDSAASPRRTLSRASRVAARTSEASSREICRNSHHSRRGRGRPRSY